MSAETLKGSQKCRNLIVYKLTLCCADGLGGRKFLLVSGWQVN